MILYKASKFLTFDVLTAAMIVISVLLMIGNFFLLHAVMKKVNARISSPDKDFNIVTIPGRN